MTKLIKTIALLLALFYLPISSFGWGMTGHRIVGQIAESYLSKKARKEVYKILGNESIAITSTWPDFIKADSNYAHLSPWHYINFKSGLNESGLKTLLANDTSINAYTKINWLVSELKMKTTEPDNRLMYLRLLIHIVGDIHQPLHVGRPDDRGGNTIRLSWFNNPYNLHQVWDDRLIDLQQLSYTEYAIAINHTTREQREHWQAEPVSEWIWQSYQLVQKIYEDIKPDDKLGYLYNFKNIRIVNQQLLKGGVHLAGLLNEIFG
jgi:hypothetical protein